MPLLANATWVELRGEAFELRPSLRLAFAVFREHELRTLIGKITEGHLGIAAELIEPHCDLPYLEHAILAAGLDTLAPALVEYTLGLAGIDADAKPDTGRKSKRRGKTLSTEEQLLQLFRYGCGWLGWTPYDTLDASPAEIAEALKGRTEMLRAIFGSEEKAEPDEDLTLDQKFARTVAAFNPVRVEG